jgi:hypothetical protein
LEDFRRFGEGGGGVVAVEAVLHRLGILGRTQDEVTKSEVHEEG